MKKILFNFCKIVFFLCQFIYLGLVEPIIEYIYYSFILKIRDLFKLKIWNFVLYKIMYPMYYRSRHLFLMLFFKTYGLLYDLYTWINRQLIFLVTSSQNGIRLFWYKICCPLYYVSRHILLMAVYKSYGVTYDLYTWINRQLILLVTSSQNGMRLFWYKICYPLYYVSRHLLLMTIYKSYGVIYDLYRLAERGVLLVISQVHQGRDFIKLQIWNTLWYRICCPLYYRGRHLLLMTVYKIYGFFFDLGMMGFHIGKIYILFPIRKLYWFTKFQYEKRIRKIIRWPFKLEKHQGLS